MRKIEIAAIVQGLAPLLRAFADRLAAVEAKERGLDGRPGETGPRGPDGPEGPPGRDGRDGVIGRSGADGLDGKDGANGLHGKDGADGLGFDDLEPVYDEVGRLSLRFTRGDVVKTFRVPGFVDRGVWKDGLAYETGDGTTFGGSFWIARAATTQKPGDGATAWRLAVKVGREGREGKPGANGGPGPKGDPGTPGRDYR